MAVPSWYGRRGKPGSAIPPQGAVVLLELLSALRGLFTPGASPVPLTAWVQLRFGCMSVLQSGVDYSLENIPTQIRIVLEKRHCGLVF